MNDKVKSLFFSQYLGQELTVTSIPENVNYPNYPFDINESGLFLSGILGSQIIVRRIAEDVKDRFNQTSLLLRDISQLTDEEGLNIDIIWGYGKTSNCDHGKKLGGWIVNNSRSLYPDISFRVFSYLLRIGILLPFTYLSETNQPITLTPAEIINLGWAKIKSNEQ